MDRPRYVTSHLDAAASAGAAGAAATAATVTSPFAHLGGAVTTTAATAEAATAATVKAAAPGNATKIATDNAEKVMNREVREASAAGATWRTMVRALHRTTHVVSLDVLTDTVMTRTTTPIARVKLLLLLPTRLSGLLYGTSSSSTSSNPKSGFIRVA